MNFNEYINILKTDTSDGKINCYWYSNNLYCAYMADIMYIRIALIPIFQFQI